MEIGKQYILDKGKYSESKVSLLRVWDTNIWGYVKFENGNKREVMLCRLSNI